MKLRIKRAIKRIPEFEYVRCRKCRNRDIFKSKECQEWCNLYGRYMDSNAFCAEAVKEKGEANER